MENVGKILRLLIKEISLLLHTRGKKAHKLNGIFCLNNLGWEWIREQATNKQNILYTLGSLDRLQNI